jgi:hypothetical protein
MVAGTLPQLVTVKPEDEVIGECTVVLLGRDPQGLRAHFGLIPEAGKISLNSLVDHDTTVPAFLKKTLRTVLSSVHGMTPEITAAICDWADDDETVDDDGGAERTDAHYQSASIPYAPRNGKFETIDELRLVRGVTDELFFGEDANGNGRLDSGEDLNGNRKLDIGLRDILSVENREPALAPDGSPLTDIQRSTELAIRFTKLFPQRSTDLIQQATGGTPIGGYRNRLHLLSVLDLSETEAATLWPTLKGPEFRVGLIDAWSCSEQILTSLVGADLAGRIIAARPITPPISPLWLTQILTVPEIINAGMILTVGGYQFRADILAVSRHGWARIDALIDCSTNFPRVTHLRPTESLGWPLPWATPAMLRQANATQDFSTMLTSDRN